MKKVSIITSLYKAEKYLKGFLENIVQQTIFNDCELFLLDANSPENEHDVIKPFLSYANIRYERLEDDPGIYGCWNYMIENSDSKYITNANVDDKLFHNSIKRHVDTLEEFSNFDLAYCVNILSHTPPVEPELLNGQQQTYPTGEFSKSNMLASNLPHNHPVWRRSMHEDCGLFNEKYFSASDYDFWLRASIEFGKEFILIPEALGIYYFNPEGMSTKNENRVWISKEETEIRQKYSKILEESHSV